MAAGPQQAAADVSPDKEHLPRVGQQTAGPQNSHRAASEDAPRDSSSVTLQHCGICLQHQLKALQLTPQMPLPLCTSKRTGVSITCIC